MAAETTSHANVTMESRVVRGYVRDDVDWRPALESALRVAYSDPEPQDLANAIDAAMIRAIHSAARMGAVVELGVQIHDSTNPLRRLAWRLAGSRQARARADALNQQTAALDAADKVV
jgi:hypothetical protein